SLYRCTRKLNRIKPVLNIRLPKQEISQDLFRHVAICQSLSSEVPRKLFKDFYVDVVRRRGKAVFGCRLAQRIVQNKNDLCSQFCRQPSYVSTSGASLRSFLRRLENSSRIAIVFNR